MKTFLAVVFFFACCVAAVGQTNPTAFDLSTGSYTFTTWASSSTSGTYPSNMVFHKTSTQDPGLSVETTGDYTGSYSGTSGTRMNGLGGSGFAFINTGTSGYLGAAVLALNASGRSNVQVSWTGGTVTTAASGRVYAIRLQYRVGTSASWQDVSGPIEYTSSSTAGDSTVFSTTTLPSDVNNQSIVQLRWKYYSVSGSSGTRPQLRVANITVSSQQSVATPTKLVITSINGGASPSIDGSFTATVQAEDSTGTAANVTQSTSFALSVATGTGVLSGTTSGTIDSGTSSVTVSGIYYSVAETGVSITATRTSGDALSSGTSATFTVLEAATKLVFSALSTSGQDHTFLASVVVQAQRSDGSVDPYFVGQVTLSKATGSGNLSGTLTETADSGAATFDSIQFDQKGIYTLTASATGLTSATSDSIRIMSLTEVILPQYIQGLNGTNASRIPFVFRLTLSGLAPSTTYRYFNQAVKSTDALTASGSGNVIFPVSAGAFVRSSNPALSSSENYGEFTSDASGEYTGWFITEPTGNARFAVGNSLYMRINLNDGANGSTVATRLTTTSGTTVINFGTTSSDATGIWGASSETSSNFMFLYDAQDGSGRPIAGTFVESDGSANTTSNNYVSFYSDSVNGIDGRWGTILPNALSNGIRRIESRSLTTGAIVDSAEDSDGVWPSGASTVNPSGGTTAIKLLTTDLLVYTLTTSATNGTVTKSPDQTTYQYGTTVQLTVTPTSGYHFLAWTGDVPTGQGTDNPLTVTMNQNRTIVAYCSINPVIPVLASPTFETVTSSSAVLGATISSDGNATIRERGIVWSTTASPDTLSNRVSTTGTTGSYTVTVSGLPAGMLIYFRGYAINSVGTGYTADTTFYTLSTEPSSHVSDFTGSALADTEIDLSWGTATGASGYLILECVEADPTGVPVDGGGYTTGATLGNGTIAAVVTSGTTTTAAITGLTASTSYHFSIIPFAWDGTNSETYNYKTDDTIPTTSITTLQGPELKEIILPQYIEGINGTNANRIPFAYRARITGLSAQATYRYTNQVVTSADAGTTSGAGNCIFVSTSGDFVRTSSPSLATSGTYGTFTTDSDGVYEGWFITEPTGNARFVPGNYIFMRIMINNGADGTSVRARLTTMDSVRVVKLDSTISDSTGTGLRCTSPASAKDFVFAYNSETGTGRPISGSFVESDGTENSSSDKYATFYADSVDGVAGAFGIVVPNDLPNGIRRFENCSLSTGTVLDSIKDEDGVWPSGANTVNPSGGITAIVLTGADLPFTTPHTVTVQVSSGWQMVSNPVVTASDSTKQIYPSAISSAFKYSGAYKRAYILQPGVGYWLKFSSGQSVNITGITLTADTIDVTTGWNMIGSITTPLLVSAIASEPAGMITSSFYGFQGRYARVDTIQPGKAYWVKVKQAGQLILSTENTSLAKKSSSLIQIESTSEMPPDPPDEAVSSDGIPTEFALCQNYPNPFNPTTAIGFDVPTTGRVVLRVYDVLGQKVATLVDEVEEAGHHSVSFNAQSLPSGVYMCKMNAGSFAQVQRMMLIK